MSEQTWSGPLMPPAGAVVLDASPVVVDVDAGISPSPDDATLIEAARISERPMDTSSVERDPVYEHDAWGAGRAEKAMRTAIGKGQASSSVPNSFEALLDQHAARIQQNTDRAISALNVDLTESTQGLVAAVHAQLSTQIAAVDSKADTSLAAIAEFRAKADAQALEIQQLKANQSASTVTLEHHSQRMEQVRTAVREEVKAREAGDHDATYAAPPNQGILRLHVQGETISKAELLKICRAWLEGVFKDDEWTLGGEDEAKRFTLRSNSLARTAAIQVKQARDLLRPATRGGQWK